MLDKIKAKIFPSMQLIHELRDDHANAARNNEMAHRDLNRTCTDFSHLSTDRKIIVNPR